MFKHTSNIYNTYITLYKICLSQNHQNLHNKDDKLVTEVTKELDSFKRFFQLIDKAQRKLEELEAQRKLVLKDDDYEFRLLDIEYEILSNLKLQRTCQSLCCRFGLIWVAKIIIR